MKPRPRRIQKQRTKGWRLPEGCRNVARPTRYGNPFKVGERLYVPSMREGTDITPEIAVVLYRAWLRNRPALVLEMKQELRGCDLACGCREDAEWCHADVIIDLVNPPTCAYGACENEVEREGMTCQTCAL